MVQQRYEDVGVTGGGRCKFGGARFEVGGVKSKARGLGYDRGYRAVVGVVWAGFGLNPHPLKPEGAAPKLNFLRELLLLV